MLYHTFLSTSNIGRIVLFSFIFVVISSCTTIELGEDDAFDNHRTVTPASFSSDVFKLEEYDVETPDGELLNAWWLTREDALGTVLYFGGNGFLLVKSRIMKEAYETFPVNVLFFDYRGYGLSTGTPSIEGLLTDIESIRRFATEELGQESERIIYHGHSMGSFMAARLAEQHEAAGYILESPVTNVDDWTGRMVPFLLKPFVRFDIQDDIAAQDNMSRVKRTEMPLLIISGDEDPVTPSGMAEDLYEASSTPSDERQLRLIEGGGHNDLPDFESYRNAVRAFLRAQLSEED
jgi:pimeloyl-ACP methyl ester carboxylesterase